MNNVIQKNLYKTCTRCKLTKPIEEFYKQVQGIYGCKSECKECSKKLTSDDYQIHKKERNATKRKWCIRNRKRYNEVHLKWVHDNREHYNAYHREYKQRQARLFVPVS